LIRLRVIYTSSEPFVAGGLWGMGLMGGNGAGISKFQERFGRESAETEFAFELLNQMRQHFASPEAKACTAFEAPLLKRRFMGRPLARWRWGHRQRFF
jgi:hypothetical protein